MSKRYYAVAIGREPGIYNSWDECERQVKGFSGSAFKSFSDLSEAREFISRKRSVTLMVTADPNPAETPGQLLKRPRVEPAISRRGKFHRSNIKSYTTDPQDCLVAFTDGSCLNNGKRCARAAYAVVWPFSPNLDTAQSLTGSLATNNRAEYMGMLTAMDSANDVDPTRSKKLHIFTDSKLLISSLCDWIPGWKRRGWKKADGSAVANQDLIMKCEAHRESGRDVMFTHVRAHTGRKDWVSVWNDKVDRMARESAN